MPIAFNVLSGKQDLRELPLRIMTQTPQSTDLGEGELVIYDDGADKWLYWKTGGTLFNAKGILV